jgi:peptidoglycan-associated lipoprotein
MMAPHSSRIDVLSNDEAVEAARLRGIMTKPAARTREWSILLIALAPMPLLSVTSCQETPRLSAGRPEHAARELAECFDCDEYDHIFFDYDSAKLHDEVSDIIDRQTAFILEHPSLTYTIEGHCDERGTTAYNLALGARRAETLRAALVARGADPSHFRRISYGGERPAVIGHMAEAWAQNRRAVLTID